MATHSRRGKPWARHSHPMRRSTSRWRRHRHLKRSRCSRNSCGAGGCSSIYPFRGKASHSSFSIERNRMKVSVLGLGIMGAGMAGQLVAKGFEVSVWNRNPAKAARFEKLGARVATTPADAADGADLVIAMLADDDASRGVWLGPAGALASMRREAIAIESSTLTIEWVRE